MDTLQLDQFRSILRQSKHIVVIAGAGLSAASGIPTFRGAGGLWRSYEAMKIATPEAFSQNPNRVWQFYHMRREKVKNALPNAAHYALAECCLSERRKTIAPSATFTLITQNIDGLSVRALEETRTKLGLEESPVSDVVEMHGRLYETTCRACGDRRPNYDSPIASALAGTEVLVERGVKEPVIHLRDLPRCQKCDGLLRPGVVWFGEMPLYLDEIQGEIDRADLCLVVGTSSTIYPAAGYAHEVKDNGGKLAVFNIERSNGDDEADFLFLGPCEKTLPEALWGSQSDGN